MKLLVDCIPYDEGKSGISVYIRNVVRELAAAGHSLTLLVEPGVSKAFAQYETIEAPGWTRRAAFSMVWHMLLLPRLIRRRQKEFDRVVVLAANRRMMIRSALPVTAIVHDLSQYHVPAKYDCLRMFYILHLLPWAVRRCAQDVVAISHCTAKDLVEFWRIPQERIRVVYNGINRARLPLGENHGTGNTVVYVSRIEHPGKNHVRLIEAWEQLTPEVRGDRKLLFVGAPWSGAEVVEARIAASPCKESIQLMGFVSSEELQNLYRTCCLFVFPSLFEGFGLGLIEAMACGAVCASSCTSSLGELAGDAAVTFDPEDSQDIARAMTHALTDPALRETLREKSIAHAAAFDWRLTAEALIPPRNETCTVLGVTSSAGTMDEALECIADTLAAPSARPQMACFVNADCYNQAFTNPAYYDLLIHEAKYVWPDGAGIAWASKVVGEPIRDNVNGTDMLPLLCERGWRLYLLGGQPGIAERAAANLRATHPQAQIVGTHHGFIKSEDEAGVIAKINGSGAQILLVAMGVPRQEQWMVAHRDQLQVPLMMGVGGLFDFASGRIPRAPMWMRRAKIEWVFRLMQEPRRLFRRYIIGNPLFIHRVRKYGRTRPQ